MTRRTFWLLSPAVVAISVGCGDVLSPAEYPCLDPAPSIGNREAMQPGQVWTQDDAMAELARQIPGGFGGLFVGRIDGIGAPDKINIYLLRLDERTASFDALAARAEAARSPFLRGIDGREPGNYHALPGDFDFLQLLSCKAALSSGGVFDVPELHGLGIDERRNRIHVDVEEGGVKKVRAKAREIGVPVQMILIEVGEPAVLLYGSRGRSSGGPM